jgi:hypothetical protein
MIAQIDKHWNLIDITHASKKYGKLIAMAQAQYGQKL